jgi:hypothetical protein
MRPGAAQCPRLSHLRAQDLARRPVLDLLDTWLAGGLRKDAPNTDYRVKEGLPIGDDLFVGDSDAHGE